MNLTIKVETGVTLPQAQGMAADSSSWQRWGRDFPSLAYKPWFLAWLHWFNSLVSRTVMKEISLPLPASKSPVTCYSSSRKLIQICNTMWIHSDSIQKVWSQFSWAKAKVLEDLIPSGSSEDSQPFSGFQWLSFLGILESFFSFKIYQSSFCSSFCTDYLPGLSSPVLIENVVTFGLSRDSKVALYLKVLKLITCAKAT